MQSGVFAMPVGAMSTAVHLGTETEMARAFETAWAAPTPERLVALLHDDVVLFQPQLPPIRGKAAARAEFERLFRWLPATHGIVDRTLSAPGVTMIEWRLVFPIGRHGTTIPIVDRLTIRDALIAERAAYFDQTPILIAVGARPWLLPGFARYRFGS